MVEAPKTWGWLLVTRHRATATDGYQGTRRGQGMPSPDWRRVLRPPGPPAADLGSWAMGSRPAQEGQHMPQAVTKPPPEQALATRAYLNLADAIDQEAKKLPASSEDRAALGRWSRALRRQYGLRAVG